MGTEHIGRNIKANRKAQGMTQIELACKINKAESTVRKYENGSIEIPYSVLEKISQVLEVSVLMLGAIDFNDYSQKVEKQHLDITLRDLIRISGFDCDYDSSQKDKHYTIRYKKQDYKISVKDYHDFQKEILSYTEYKLLQLIKNDELE